jgi:hypothetical protein
MKNIPDKIYLQINAGCDLVDNFKELEVSWCSEKVYEDDLVYYSKEEVENLIKSI